ncbi:MAG TPA: choice-of-anchor D domain-containing protein [Acidobacteriaceae bacterium]|jgi:sugar lactone lactonase YvrE
MRFRSNVLNSVFPALSLLILCAALPTAAAAQAAAAFNGNANFGTVALGQTSSTMTLTATFSAAATLGAPAALTQGAPGLDFALTGAGTCKAGQSYTAGQSCTVVATMTPQFAGARYGAAVLTDAGGNTVASAYLQGVGSGPQAGFQPQAFSVRSFPYNGVLPVRALAVDGAGNIFVGSSINGKYGTVMDEIPAGCEDPSCVKTLAGTFGAPWGVAVDGAGNVFVADVGASGKVFEIPASGGYSTVKTLSGNFGTVTSLAVDGSGNIFLSDNSSGAVKEIVAAGGYTTVTTVAGGFTSPEGIKVDANGNVFVTDHNTVKEIVAVNGTIPASPVVNALGSGWGTAIELVLDATGNVYVTDANSGHLGLFEILAAGGYTTVQSVAKNFSAPTGVAMDPGGNFYVVDNGVGGDFLNLVPRATATGLNFQTPTPPGYPDTADGPLTTILTNIGNMPLNLSGFALSSTNFTLDNGTTTCTASSVLAPGAACTVGVTFTPQASASSVSGTLTFTDNSLNVTAATQPVNLSGAALITPAVIVSANPHNVVVTQPVTVTITVTGISGKPTPTGTVQLAGGGYISAVTTLSNGSATINLPAGSLPIGAIPLYTRYSPDDASSSTYFLATGMGSVVVTSTAMIQPTITVTPSLPSTAITNPLTITAAISGGSGNPAPTGTVVLTSGAYSSATLTLSNGSATFVIPANTLTLGTNVFTILYTPDSASSTLYLGVGFSGWITVTNAPPPAGSSSPGFGTIAIGQTSAAIPITLTFGNSATIGSLAALTQGASGLDYAVASGGTCANGATLTAGQSCTVNVTFTPKFAGQRSGGVVALDSQGKTLALAYVHGIGSGPQLRFMQQPYYDYVTSLPVYFPGSGVLLSNGFNHPSVGVDGAGNVFVADWGNNQIKEIPAGCQQASCTTVAMGGIFAPSGVAVDGAGNLFVSAIGFNQVLEIPLGCQNQSCIQSIGGGFNQPYGISIDASGNLFVADTYNNAVKEILAAGGYTTTLTLGSGLNLPWGAVVDSAGNLFVAEGGDQCDVFIPGVCHTINTSLVELPAAGGYTTTTVISSGGFGKPLGLTIDGNNNVYVADFGDSCANEFNSTSGYGSYQRLCARSIFANPEGLAVQSNGDIILPDVIQGTVSSLNFNDQLSLIFPTAAQAGNTDSVDGTQTLTFQNNGNAPLTFSAMTFSDPSFQFDAGVTSCLISKPLAPGSICTIGVTFSPTSTGSHNATLTLVNNNLNQSAATYVVPITADALPATPVILTNPANPTAVTSATFTFSDTQAGVTFVCSIDSLAFNACASGIVYPGLSNGQHSFQVKAKDAVGALSLAAVYNWTVNAVSVTAPVITSGPGHATNADTVTFAFTDTQAGVSFMCSLDGVAFAPCTSGISYSGVQVPMPYKVVGLVHNFAVEAVDASNNVSSATSYGWLNSIDTVPGTQIDFGALAVGQTSAAQTVTFTFDRNQASNTIATIDATTLGILGLDFAVSDPGTCAVGTAIGPNTTCTLKVTFSPTYAGTRKGGVILLNAAGKGIGEAYLNGIGIAPQVTFTPYTLVNYNILPAQNNTDPTKNLITVATEATVDGSGNVYVSDAGIATADQSVAQSAGDVWEFPVGCTTPACIKQIESEGGVSGYTTPVAFATGIVMDGAGLIWTGSPYVQGNNQSTVGSWTASQFFFNFTFNPMYVEPTVDGGGLVTFAGDGILTFCGLQLGAQATGLSFDFSGTASSVAVDPQGNLFVADTGNNAVKEVLASSNYTISRVVGSGFNKPVSVASDTVGNIFVADQGNSVIKEMVAASNYSTILTIAPFNLGTTTLGNNLSVDFAGNIYVPNQSGTGSTNQLVKLDFADAPALTFPTATQIGTIDATDGTLTATVKNSGNAPLNISAMALSNNNFQIDANVTTCSTSVPVAVGGSCAIGVLFSPGTTGSLIGTLTLTDNALNANSAKQTFALSGTSFLTAPTSTPTVVVTPGVTTLTTAQSLSVTVTVGGARPNTSFASNAAPTGSTIPTGSVSLSSGSYASSAVTLSGGTATFSIPAGALAVGSDTLTAIYAPDAAASTTYNDGAGTATVSVTAAAKATPTVTVTPSPTTITTAQAVSVTVIVDGGSGNPMPTGSITLISGAYSSGSVLLNNGSATIAIPARTLSAGVATLMANYAPDFNSTPNYNNATGSSTLQVQAIAKITPTVTVSPNPGSITATQTVAVSIALNGGIGTPTPTGTVVLSSGAYTSGYVTLSNGSAAITIPAGSLASGTDTLTASYTPDTAGATTYNAALGTGVVMVTAITAVPAPTILTGPTNPTTATTAAFTFSDTQTGVTFLCSLDSGAYAACSSGISYTSLALGGHTFAVKAQASADNVSVATTYPWTINAATVQVSVGTTPAGLAFSVDGNAYTTTQTLTWTVGSTHTLATASPQTSNGIQNTFSSWSDAGAASHSVTATAGTTTYTAAFNTSYLLSTSASPANGGSVQPATGTYYAAGTVVNLTATPNSGYTFSNWTGNVAAANSASTTVTMNAAQAVTANFSVVLAPAASLTPGTLSFTSVAGTATAAQSASLQNTGNAPLTISAISLTGTNATAFAITTGTNACGSSLTAGSMCNIYVTFTPSSAASFTANLSVADNAGGSPQTTVLNGTGTAAPSYTVSSPNGSQTIAPGGKATYTITVTPQNGAYNNSVTFTASGLPSGATATFSPASLTPGSTAASSTLTIQTPVPVGATTTPHWLLGSSPVLAGMVLFFLPHKRRRRFAALGVLLLASLGAITALTGCGGGWQKPGPGTLNYTITVTATSGATQQTTTVQLTVQ